MKRLLLLLLICTVSLSLVSHAETSADEKTSAVVTAAEDLPIHVSGDIYRDQNFLYRVLEDQTAEIVYFAGDAPIHIIPDHLGGYPVSVIGRKAFSNEGWIQFYTDSYPDYFRKNIYRLTLPEGITRIEEYAFERCFNLTEIVFPSSLKSIGEGAFDKCIALMKADLPDHLEQLGSYAFRDCYTLISAALPASLSTIGANPYVGCRYLHHLDVSPNHPSLRYEKGLLIDTLQHKLISSTRESWLNNSWDTIYIPDGIVSIGDAALGSNPVSAFHIPSTVTSIGDFAFMNCDYLIKLTIPENIQFIGANPVLDCDSLSSITVSENQSRYIMQDDMLIDKQESRLIVSLRHVVGEMSVLLKIFNPYNPVRGKSEPYDIICQSDKDSEMRYIYYDTYNNNTIYSMLSKYTVEKGTVPDGIRIIGPGAFYGSFFEEIILPDTVEEIGDHAFAYSRFLKKCILPSHLRIIPPKTFYYCLSLEETGIPEGTISIGDYAFAYTRILEFILPTTLEKIGDYCFSYITPPEKDFGDGLDWYDHYMNVEFHGDRLTVIPKGAFAFSHITGIRLPSSIAEIQTEAFTRTDLETIVIPSGVTAISEFCFFDSSLKDIELPTELEYIGDQAFRADDYHFGSLLESFSLPSRVKYIGDKSFSLQEVGRESFPDSMTEEDFNRIFRNSWEAAYSDPEDLSRFENTVNPSDESALVPGIEEISLSSLDPGEEIHLPGSLRLIDAKETRKIFFDEYNSVFVEPGSVAEAFFGNGADWEFSFIFNGYWSDSYWHLKNSL